MTTPIIAGRDGRTHREVRVNSDGEIVPLGMFNHVATAERTPIIELKSSFGQTVLRDITTTAGSATISNSVGDGEYKLATTANGSDSAELQSTERGQYIPGSSAAAGLYIRLPQDMTGSQEARWGYMDDDDGVFFGQDSNGLFVQRRTGGTDQSKIRQSDWNHDVLDGSGNRDNPSGLNLDLTAGSIYQIDFTWYGDGPFEFKVFLQDNEGRKQEVIVHRMNVTGELSVENPNLPIRAVIDNGGTATAANLFVGGRQFSILGRERPNRRINGEFRTLGSIGTTFLPVMSFRKKAAFVGVTATAEKISALADAQLRWQLRLNPSLTNASFGSLTDTTASETALEVDTSATALSGGEILDKGLFSTSGGNKETLTQTNTLPQILPEQQPITLAVRTLSGTGATVDTTMTIREQW